MKKTVSCKRLSEILNTNGFNCTVKSLRSSCEAYGKKVFAYVNVKDMETRKNLEKTLYGQGIHANTNYSPGSPVLEIPVSYFKAYGWDE